MYSFPGTAAPTIRLLGRAAQSIRTKHAPSGVQRLQAYGLSIRLLGGRPVQDALVIGFDGDVLVRDEASKPVGHAESLSQEDVRGREQVSQYELLSL